MAHTVETFVKNGVKFTTWKEGSTQYVTADFDDERSAVAVQVVLETSGYKGSVRPAHDRPGKFILTAGREWWPDGKPPEITENGQVVIDVGDGHTPLPDKPIDLRPSGLSVVRKQRKT